jgi:hypothetical protein
MFCGTGHGRRLTTKLRFLPWLPSTTRTSRRAVRKYRPRWPRTSGVAWWSCVIRWRVAVVHESCAASSRRASTWIRRRSRFCIGRVCTESRYPLADFLPFIESPHFEPPALMDRGFFSIWRKSLPAIWSAPSLHRPLRAGFRRPKSLLRFCARATPCSSFDLAAQGTALGR